MATILPTYDWSESSKHTDKPRTRLYPWPEWLDGRIRELTKGEDFDGPAASFANVARTTANRKGIKVRVRSLGESTVVLQAHLDDARSAPRGVTKSASQKAVKEARAAAEAGEGNGVAVVAPPKPVKKAVAKATVPAKPAAPSKRVSGNGKVPARKPVKRLVKAGG
jgi:hypothetical protein